MTNRELIRLGRKLWDVKDRKLDRYNRRAWLRSVRRLGDKWVTLIKEPRLEKKSN